ncbi:MAG TPA: HAEPLYID family protein [Adhaeribacter sp.]|nr:HAEPLYID family protein [Adhaeribacter sp.]
MKYLSVLFFFFLVLNVKSAQAQAPDTIRTQLPDTTQTYKEQLDQLYIEEIQGKQEPEKVLHAEPLYIDLIRDLGARKGEKEWNVGGGITDNLNYDVYEALIEYEWAPIDRLGLEVELPFTFIGKRPGVLPENAPSSQLNGLKLAAQWSFFVSQKRKTTLALGYINELEFSTFQDFGNPWFTGNVYNPFFVAAKRWGNNWHTLIYTGPRIEQHFRGHGRHFYYDFNSNLHFMIPGTRNFIGMEVNKIFAKDDFDMVIRPQMRVGIAENFLVGIVGGIPVKRENQRLSTFIRLIWEPGHKVHHK